MKRFLIFAIIALLTVGAYASKANSTLIPRKQPDGTVLMIKKYGDEHFNYCTTADGVLLKRMGKAYYVARVTENGELESTGMLAHEAKLRDEAEKLAIKNQNVRLFRSRLSEQVAIAKRKAHSSEPYYPTMPLYLSHEGTVHVPIIFVEFQNRKFSFPIDELKDKFCGTEIHDKPQAYNSGPSYSSAAQYFKESSHGKFDLQFDFYGKYTLPKNYEYYGAENSEIRLISDAIPLCDADIDFSKYDIDNDGLVDLVYFVFAGCDANFYGEEGVEIWSHSGCFASSGIMAADGKMLNRYGMNGELLLPEGNDKTGTPVSQGLGVFCHELCHALGLPDLYYDFGQPAAQDNNGPEDWDLMDNGENLRNGFWPPLLSLWERIEFGWIDPVELTEPQKVTVWPLNDPEGRGVGYIVKNPANEDEYWTIENIPAYGWYQGMYGSGNGIIICHVNYSDEVFHGTTSANTVFNKPNLAIIPADGYMTSSYNVDNVVNGIEITKAMYHDDLRGDPYPGSKNVTKLAAYNNYAGSVDMIEEFAIDNITLNADGSVTFQFMGGGNGIKTINQNAKTTIYTIEGRKVSTPLRQGIYVQNGRKLIH